MCDEIQKAAVPRPRPDRADDEGAEDDGEHNAEVGRQGQGECVVEAQALEGVATEEAANELSDAAGEPEPIAGHRDGESRLRCRRRWHRARCIASRAPPHAELETPTQPARATSTGGQGAQQKELREVPPQ